MLLFCPSCSNMLTITPLTANEYSPASPIQPGNNRFTCPTCPYSLPLTRRYYERRAFELDATEDVLGGADSWKNVDKTPIACANERCGAKEAYFRQVQIRSADEPMTSFYKCVTCKGEWREG